MVGETKGGTVVKEGVLHELRARVTRWLALRVILVAAATLAGLALAAVICDAALDLAENVRLATPWLLSLAVVAILCFGFFERRRFTDPKVARLLEKADTSLGNRLINAVQLAQQKCESPTGEFLRAEVVRIGQEAAAQQSAWRIMRGGIQGGARALGGVLALWLLLLILGSDLVHSVLPRFLDPHGDHPPYSRLKIEVAPRGGEVIYGGQLELRATTSGRPVDKLWLVAHAGTNETRTIMFLAPDKTFFQTLVNLRESTEYFVTDGSARSRRFPINIRYTPQITSAEMTEIFPDYTGEPARTMQLSDETQAVLEGTQVRFRLTSNRPLKSGTLELTPVLGGKPVSINLTPESANIVSGQFTLSEPVVFNLSVRDVSGLECAEPRRGRLNVVADHPPRVFVIEPGRDAVATPSIKVPVHVQATDDYGVTRVVWLRGFNQSVERPFNMKLALKGGPRSVESTGAFDLEKLGVHAGDVIEYYFEAADNYPKGPNVAFSRPFRLEVISREQYEEVLRQAAARKALFEPYFKLDAWMRRLAERSRDLKAKADQGDPNVRAEAQELEKQLEELQKQMSDLMQQALMFDVEQSFATTLVAQQAGISQAAENLKKALGSGQLGSNSLKDISDRLSALADKQDEQVDQPAQQIAAVARVVAKADDFTKLAQEQAALAKMLKRYADKSGPLSQLEQMEVQELSHRQDLVRDALKEMMKQLPDLLAQVPPDADYNPLRKDVQEFLKAVADAKIEQDLADASSSLSEPDTATGYALAQRAADEMDKLVGKCNSQGQANECLVAHFAPKLAKPGLGDTLSQILTAMGAGNGQNGRDGYSLFNESVALYGPNMELAGEQAGGAPQPGHADAARAAELAGDTADSALPPPGSPGRVRLQTDAKFPLRYRDIVGEYFRVIAESEQEGDK